MSWLRLDWFDVGCMAVAALALVDAFEARASLRKARWSLGRVGTKLDTVDDHHYYGRVSVAVAPTLYDQDKETR